MNKAIELKFNRGVVWATLHGTVAQSVSEPLSSRVQAFACLVSCWRILIDCRSLGAQGSVLSRNWQQTLLGQLRLPEGARAALVFENGCDADVQQLRETLSIGQTTAVFTDLRAAVRWLRATDTQPLARRRKALPLGAIKELLHQFARARSDTDKAQLAAELGELYHYLLEQAEKMGIDPQRAIDLNRARAARWRPRLVHSRGMKSRTTRH
jgi:hypothetical protein